MVKITELVGEGPERRGGDKESSNRHMKVQERFAWAVDLIDPGPRDRILEIGCGAGLLVEQLAMRLDKGIVVGLDRSRAMIESASKRNARSVSSGKVSLLNMNFADSDFRKNEFDAIIAFNVSFFWKPTMVETQMIPRLLKPKGMVYVFYQAPYEIDLKFADLIKKELEKNSLTIVDVIKKEMKPTAALCVKATR